MMEPNFHFNDALVKAHQDRLKKLWNNDVNAFIDEGSTPRGWLRTATGNLLIRWGERVSGCERRAAANAAPGRLAS